MEEAFAEGAFEEARQKGNRLLEQFRNEDELSDLSVLLAIRIDLARLRALASARHDPPTELNQLVQSLQEKAVSFAEKTPDGSPAWLSALIWEELGFAYIIPEANRHPSLAWNHLQKALDVWAHSPESEGSRQAFIRMMEAYGTILFEQRPQNVHFRSTGYLSYWEDARLLARESREQALMAFYHASALQSARHLSQQNLTRWEQTMEAFLVAEEFHEKGYLSDWFILNFGRWLSSSGQYSFDEQGRFNVGPDMDRALDLLRSFLDDPDKALSPVFSSVRDLYRNLTRKSLSIQSPGFFTSGATQQLQLGGQNIREGTLELLVHRVSIDEVVDWEGSFSPLSWQDQGAKLDREPDFSYRPELPPGDERLSRETIFTIPQPLSSGLWQVTLRSGESSRSRLILVTDRMFKALIDPHRVVVQYIEGKDGHPIENKKIVVMHSSLQGEVNSGSTRNNWKRLTATTNKDGFAEFYFDLEDPNRLLFIWADEEEHPAVTYRSIDYSLRFNDPFYFQVHADRPLYEPGETVHWKLFGRQVNDHGVFEFTDLEELQFFLVTPKGEELLLQPEAVLPGSVAGSIQVDPDWPQGIYNLKVKSSRAGEIFGILFGERPPHNPRTLSDQAFFRVDRFTPPEIEFEASTFNQDGEERTVLRRGDIANIEVRTHFFHGAPASGVRIKASVQPSLFSITPRIGSSWQRQPRGSQRVEVFEMVTDGQGKASFQVEIPMALDHNIDYNIRFEVVESGGETQVFNHSFSAFRLPFMVNVEPGFLLYRPNDQIGISIFSKDGEGNPYPAQGKLTLLKIEDKKIFRHRHEERFLSREDFEALPTSARRGDVQGDFTLEHTLRAEKVVWVRDLRLTEEGEKKIDFRLEEEGRYRLQWVSLTEKDGPVFSDASFHVAADAPRDIRYDHGGLVIIPQTTQIRPGETLDLLLATQFPGHPIVLSIESDGLQDYQLIRMEGVFGRVSLPIESSLVPNFTITASSFENYREFNVSEEIGVIHQVDPLEFLMEFNQVNFEPGEEGLLTIRLNDFSQDDMADFSLAIFDEAILQIQPELAKELVTVFQPRRRLPNVISSRPQGGLEAILSERSQREILALVHESWKLVGQNEELLRQENRNLFHRGGPRSPFSPPETGRLSAAPMGLDLMESAPRQQAVAELAFDDMEAAVLREQFASSVLWLSSVDFDSDGVATIPFQLPDNLTRWIAVGRGAMNTDRFGEARQSVQSKKLLMSRILGPAWITEGDEFDLNLSIQSTHPNELRGVFRFEFEDLLSADLEASNSRFEDSFRLSENEILEKRFRFIADQAGSPKVSLEARSEVAGDAVQKLIQVHPGGLAKTEVQRILLSGNEDWDWSYSFGQQLKDPVKLEWNLLPSWRQPLYESLGVLLGNEEEFLFESFGAAVAFYLSASNLLSDDLDKTALLNYFDSHPDFGPLPGWDKDSQSASDWLLSRFNEVWDYLDGTHGWTWLPVSLYRGDPPPPNVDQNTYALWLLQKIANRREGIFDSDKLIPMRSYLERRLEERNRHLATQAWMLHALAVRFQGQSLPRPSRLEVQIFSELYQRRQELDPRARALLTLSAFYFGLKEEAQALARSLPDGGSRTMDGRLAYWGDAIPRGQTMSSRHETTAWVLKALLAVRPDSELIEPAALWLLLQREGFAWRNARENTVLHLALLRYLEVKQPSVRSSGAVQLHLNGELIQESEWTDAESYLEPIRSHLTFEDFESDEFLVQLKRTEGEGSIPAQVFLSYRDRRDPIAPSSVDGLSIERSLMWLRPVESLARGVLTIPTLVEEGNPLEQGQRIEVVLNLKVEQPLRHVTIEDPGMPSWSTPSLQGGDRILIEYKETDSTILGSRRLPLRYPAVVRKTDRGLQLLIEELPAGQWVLRYEGVIDHKGIFYWAPTEAKARYLLEFRAHTESSRGTTQ